MLIRNLLRLAVTLLCLTGSAFGEPAAANASDSPPAQPEIAEAEIARGSAEFERIADLVLQLNRVSAQHGAVSPSPEAPPLEAKSIARQLALFEEFRLRQQARSPDRGLPEPEASQLRTALRDARATTERARHEALRRLEQLTRFAELSRLYVLPAPDAEGNVPLLNAPRAVVRDYLERQLARVSVLCGYAAPYVRLLDNLPPIDAAQPVSDRLPTYWRNTLQEFHRAIQLRDRAGAVGRLERLFLDGFQTPDSANAAEEEGFDLFSASRRQLLGQQGVRLTPAR